MISKPLTSSITSRSSDRNIEGLLLHDAPAPGVGVPLSCSAQKYLQFRYFLDSSAVWTRTFFGHFLPFASCPYFIPRFLQGVLAVRVLELLWSMIMAPDAHADVVAAASKGLRSALKSYDDNLDMAQVHLQTGYNNDYWDKCLLSHGSGPGLTCRGE